MYLRATATKEGEKDAQILVGYNPRTPELLSLGDSSSITRSVQASITRRSLSTEGL